MPQFSFREQDHIFMPPKVEPKSKEGPKQVAASSKKTTVPGSMKSMTESFDQMSMGGDSKAEFSASASASIESSNRANGSTMPTINRTKKATNSARAAIEEAQILGIDNMDDYETSKANLRGRKAVMEDDKRAVLDLERWDGPPLGDANEDF